MDFLIFIIKSWGTHGAYALVMKASNTSVWPKWKNQNLGSEFELINELRWKNIAGGTN